MNMGATTLTGLVGNVTLPRRASAGAAYWLTESQAITETEGTFDKVSLQPRTVGALQKFSRQMILQSTPTIEQLVRNDLVAILAVEIDRAALSGSGTAGQPLGIVGQSGVNVLVGGTNGANASFDQAIAMIAALDAANAPQGSRGFMMNGKTRGYLSSLKSSTGQYLWANGGGVGDATAQSLQGYPYGFTNQLRSNLTKGTAAGVCSEMIFGAWEDLVIGMWGTLELLVNPYDSTGFANGDVSVRCMQSVDIQARHTQSFAYISDLLTPGF